MLDVGTGTGVLALAAIRLAGARVVAFDLDPLAAPAARENAAANGLAAGLELFTGPLDALGDVAFELVVANLLKNELLPLARDRRAHRARRARRLLGAARARRRRGPAIAQLTAAGFAPAGAREAVDANGDRWTALLMKRLIRSRHPPSSCSRVWRERNARLPARLGAQAVGRAHRDVRGTEVVAVHLHARLDARQLAQALQCVLRCARPTPLATL